MAWYLELHIDGQSIEGPCADPGLEKTFQCLSYSQEIRREEPTVDDRTGMFTQPLKVAVSPIVITKSIDTSSPLLLEAAAKDPAPMVEAVFKHPAAGVKAGQFYRVTLTGWIGSVQQTYEANAVERVTFIPSRLSYFDEGTGAFFGLG